jgi:hypothetical protein
MYIVHAYLTYLLISLVATVWVARTLHTNGRVFLVDAFHGNEQLADSVNRLLVVGFYLINIGWTVLAVRTYENVDSARQLIEVLSDKVGVILIVLGAMHFFNMFVLNRFRNRGMERLMPPPLPPNQTISVGA